MDITLRVVGQADPAQIEAMKAKIEELKPALERVVSAAKSLTSEQRQAAEAVSKFDGSRIAKQAADMAKGIADIGGASKLTAREIQEVRARTDEALAKFKALGQEVPPDIARLARELDEVSRAADGIDEVGAAAERSGGKLAGMAGAAKSASLAIGAGVLAGGAALAAFGVKAVGMASDVAESQNKVNVVFGASKGAIEALADAADTSLGQTRGQVLEAAGTFGNLLTALGSSREAAAGMSVDMIKLASDLGSFNNADPTEVLEALRSGLTGEAEPMKRFGVALNEVAMKQAAMKAGMGENVQALSEAQKMQLRYNIIMEQTKAAQGDFANTSSGMANSMKIIKSGISDAVAEIGAGLLPAVERATAGFTTFLKSAKFDEVKTKVIDAFAAIGDRLASIDWESVSDTAVAVFDKVVAAIEFLADNPVVAKIVGALGLVASTFGVIMVAIGPFAPIVTSVVGAISGAVAAAGGLSAILATLAAVLTGPVAIAIGVIIGLFLLWRSKGDEIKEALSAAWEQIKSATAALVDSIKQQWEDFKASTAAKWAEIKASISSAIQGAKDKINEVLAAIRAAWDAAWGGLKAGAATAWQAIVDTVTGVITTIADVIKTGIAFYADLFTFGWGVIYNAVAAVWESIGYLVETGIEFARGVIAAGMQLLQGNWRGAWETLKGAVSSAISGVKGIASGLVSYLTGLGKDVLAKATGIGRNIVDGIKGALTSTWDGLVNKLRSLVDMLPQVVIDLLGIASPSRVFAEIGEWIVLGLASGIQKADAAAIDALAKVVTGMSTVIGGAQDFAKKLVDFVVPSDTQIREAKGKFLQLLVVMQDFTKSFAYMGAFMPVSNTDQASAQQQKVVQIMLDRLAAQFQGVKELQGLKVHDLLTGGEADWAGKLSDVMGKVSGAWGSLADNLTKMTAAKFPTPDQLEAIKVAALGILLWTAEIIKAGDMPAVVGAEDFAAVLAAAANALNSIAGLKLADITAVADAELTIAKDNIRRVGLAAWEMVTGWVRTAGDAATRAKWITDLQDFSAIVGLAASILKAGDLGDLSKLAAVTADQLRDLGANIMLAGQWVYAMVAGPGGWLATAPDRAARQKWVDDLKDFEATISAAVSIVKASVIGELESSITVNLDAAKAVLAYVRDELVPAVLGIVDGWTLAGDAAKAATERMQVFAGWIGAAVAIAKATEVGEIKSDIAVKIVTLEAILGWMRDTFAPTMQAIAAAWVVVVDESKKTTEHMQAFAGWIGAAVSIAKATEVGEIKADVLVKMNILTALLEWMRDVFAPTMEGIAAAWKVEADKAKAMTERMGLFGAWIGAAVGVAKATEVGEVKAAILVKMNILVTLLEWMRDTFAPAIEGVVSGWTMTTDAAKAMVERMTLFASIVKAAVDIARSADVGALATATSPADFGAKMAAVKANVLAMFAMIGEIAKDITLAEATARANLAEALGRGMKGLGDFGSGIGDLMSLAESKLFGSDPNGGGPLSFAQRTRGRRADFFASQLKDTVIRAVGALQQALQGINIAPDDPKTLAISQLGEAFGRLADGLKALADTKLPDAARLAALVALSAASISASPSSVSPIDPATRARQAKSQTGAAAGGGGSVTNIYNQYGVNNFVSPDADDFDGLVETLMRSRP